MPTVHNIIDSLTPWRRQNKLNTNQIKKSPRKTHKVRAREKKISESWLEEDSSSQCDTLEILTPSLSDLQFKYNWNIRGFVDKVKSNSSGLNSKPFTISASGLVTTWSLSVRCWQCENGVRLHNPVVICLNLLQSASESEGADLNVQFQFGVFNNDLGHYTMGKLDQASVNSERKVLQSVGYQNIHIGESNCDSDGNVRLGVRLSLGQKDEPESDLAALIDDELSSDMLLACKDKTFKVHRNILTARSSVIGKLMEEREENESKNSLHSESYNVTDDESEESRKISVISEAYLASDDEQEESMKSGESLDKMPVRQQKKPTLAMLEIDDITATKFLLYIYTGRFEMTDHGTVQSLLSLSDNYQVLGLKKRCEHSLMENINSNNVATYLHLGHRHSCPRLKSSALKFCKENHQNIVKDASWKKIESEDPSLYVEAISTLDTPELCCDHMKCIESSATRYQAQIKKKKSNQK